MEGVNFGWGPIVGMGVQPLRSKLGIQRSAGPQEICQESSVSFAHDCGKNQWTGFLEVN